MREGGDPLERKIVDSSNVVRMHCIRSGGVALNR